MKRNKSKKRGRKKEPMNANKIVIVHAPIECVNVISKKPLERLVVAAQVDDKGRETSPAVFEVDPPWSLYRGIAIWIGQRPEWQKPLSKALRLSAFLAELDKTDVGNRLEIDYELWRNLRDTLENDDFEIPYPYNLQLPPLFNAILRARDVEKPVIKEVKDQDVG